MNVTEKELKVINDLVKYFDQTRQDLAAARIVLEEARTRHLGICGQVLNCPDASSEFKEEALRILSYKYV